jgi:hypothetical protein
MLVASKAKAHLIVTYFAKLQSTPQVKNQAAAKILAKTDCG